MTLKNIVTGITATITLSASAAAFSANSYQEVIEEHSAAIRATEIATVRTENLNKSVPGTFQEVVEFNRAAIRAEEKSAPRSDSVSVNVPTSYQDVVNADKS